jgi:phospholipid/cholesterol/gamma-HCH transport system substrate-binding protein
MKISKEAKIGIIITSGIALLFWGLNFLKGRDFFTSQKIIFAVYDHVDGLSASNPVQVNGMRIGSISKLNLLPDNTGRIVVTMHVSDRVRIPRNSTAQIFSTDLLGAKGIRFLLGDSDEEIHDGDTLKSDIQRSLQQEVSAQVAPIRERAENILSSMDSVLVIVRTVFNEKTKSDLRQSFMSISNTMQAIESMAAKLDRDLAHQGNLDKILGNIESISSNLKNNNRQLSNIIENFSAISDTLAKSRLSETLEDTRKTLESTSAIMDKINRGEGSIGMLVNNDSLYLNLNNTARNLELLLSDLRDHPKRYVHFSVFGKKDK